jgi:alpha(1,3/1,4) fucosyltransferase
MKKKTIRIDFRYFWQGFNKKNNFFLKILKKKYNVVIDEKNPEAVFFSVFGERFENTAKTSSKLKLFSPKIFLLLKRSMLWDIFKDSYFGKKYYQRKIPYIYGDFIKIFYTPENISPDMNKCDWAFGFCYEEDFKDTHYMRLPYYALETSLKSLKNKQVNTKKKFCNFIYSNESYRRNKFFKLLNKYKIVDSPGVCMNNIAPIGAKTPTSSRGKINWQKDKLNFLKDYKFTIAFENSISDGYTTEKLTHAMQAGSIPIYFGNPSIEREFNTESFINIRDFKSWKEAISKIKELDQNEDKYNLMLKKSWLKKNNQNKWMDENRLLDRFEEIFKK